MRNLLGPRPEAPQPISYNQLLAQSSGGAQTQLGGVRGQMQELSRTMGNETLRLQDQLAGGLRNGYTRAGNQTLLGARTAAERSGGYADFLQSLASDVRGMGTDPVQARLTGMALGELPTAERVGVPAIEASAGELGLMREAGGGEGTLLGGLETAAARDLALGRSLSPEQIRESQQAARGAFSARGMAVGNPAAAAEILNRDAYGTARERERQGFASAVLGQGAQVRGAADAAYQSRMGGNMSRDLQAGMANQGAGMQQQQINTALVSGAAGMNLENRLAQAGMAGNLSGSAAGANAQGVQSLLNVGRGYIDMDPYYRAMMSGVPQSILGMSGQVADNAYARNAQLAGQVAGFNQNMQGSLYNSWMNNQAAMRGAQMQSDAARAAGQDGMMGSMIGAGGAVAGAAIGGIALVAF